MPGSAVIIIVIYVCVVTIGRSFTVLMTVHVCICIFISCLHVRVNVAKHNLGDDNIKTMQAVVFIIHVAAHLPQGARYTVSGRA